MKHISCVLYTESFHNLSWFSCKSQSADKPGGGQGENQFLNESAFFGKYLKLQHLIHLEDN